MSNPQLDPSPRRGSPSRVLMWFHIIYIAPVALLHSVTTAHGFHALLVRWQLEGRKLRRRPSGYSSTRPMLPAGSVSALGIGHVKRFGKIAARVRVHLGEAVITAVYNTVGSDRCVQRCARQTRRLWRRQSEVLDTFRIYGTDLAGQMMVT